MKELTVLERKILSGGGRLTRAPVEGVIEAQACGFLMTGTFDFNGAVYIDLKDQATNMLSPEIVNKLSTSDPEYGLHFEAVKIEFEDTAAIDEADGEVLSNVFKSMYMFIRDKSGDHYIPLADACGLPVAVTGFAAFDSDQATQTEVNRFTHVAEWQVLKAPVEVDLKSVVTWELRWLDGAQNQLGADCPLNIWLGAPEGSSAYAYAREHVPPPGTTRDAHCGRRTYFDPAVSAGDKSFRVLSAARKG